MTKTKYTRIELLEALTGKNPVAVTFTKLDGTRRDMRCTLNFELIPTENHPGLDVIRVFDLEDNGWRSFRVDSVTDFTVLR